MYPTETGKTEPIRNEIGTPNHPLHSIKIRSLRYSQNRIFDDDISREAVIEIEHFLKIPLQNEK